MRCAIFRNPGPAALAAVLALGAAPSMSSAQYGPGAPYGPYPAYAAPAAQSLGGTYFMSGDPNEPCQVIPAPSGDRALFINEHGDRVEGFIRGSQIVVPQWNLQAQLQGNAIVWSNASVWRR